jgi:hypothetical protein
VAEDWSSFITTGCHGDLLQTPLQALGFGFPTIAIFDSWHNRVFFGADAINDGLVFISTDVQALFSLF